MNIDKILKSLRNIKGVMPFHDGDFTVAEENAMCDIEDLIKYFDAPKPHISQLANSEEDCGEICQIAGRQYESVSYLKPVIVINLVDTDTVIVVSEHGHLYERDSYFNNRIGNELQIAQFILSKYSL